MYSSGREDPEEATATGSVTCPEHASTNSGAAAQTTCFRSECLIAASLTFSIRSDNGALSAHSYVAWL
jgi:hypothetical protein